MLRTKDLEVGCYYINSFIIYLVLKKEIRARDRFYMEFLTNKAIIYKGTYVEDMEFIGSRKIC